MQKSTRKPAQETKSPQQDQPTKKSIRSKKPVTKKTAQSKPTITVGLDLGDRKSHYCMLNRDGEVMEEGSVLTTEKGLRKQFEAEPRQRIALETGTHSPWISRLLTKLGHQVIVANARKLRAISTNESKSDRADAQMLARLAYSDPKLLSPIRHRSAKRQQDLNLIRSRDVLVRARTMLINAARGLVKSSGERLPACSTESFAKNAALFVPKELKAAVTPLLEQIAALTKQIHSLDGEIEKLSDRYAEIQLLRTVPGVGPVVAAAYVLTLDGVDAVANSRAAGAFLGLRPKRSQSGNSDPERGISKTGNLYLRKLLVQSAHFILGRFGPDSALRQWGLRLAGSSSQRAKKRAVVAVARKLAVLLHAMWRTGKKYQPFPEPSGKTVVTA
jgi:transposase